MSEGQGASSAFPMPPMQYVMNYSDENIKRGKAPPPPPPIQNSQVDEECVNPANVGEKNDTMIPRPLVLKGDDMQQELYIINMDNFEQQDSYTMFGAHFTADEAIIRPLEASGCRRLYPHNYDHKRELKKLNHSILVNFLDLLDVLIRAPESPKRAEKLEDINLLFINMHHLINEFRPHQARETLRVMLELQRSKRMEIAQKFQEHFDKVVDLIQSAINAIPEDVTSDSNLLSESDSLGQSSDIRMDFMDMEACDSLDKMMCNIVDGMT